MKTQKKIKKESGLFFSTIAIIGSIIGLMIGSIIGLWSITMLISGLASVDWQISEMFRQFLVATGNLGEFDTMVDYYTHIKGVEYIIAVAFFVAFPVYYKSLKPKEPVAHSK